LKSGRYHAIFRRTKRTLLDSAVHIH
jgi:hypothetical protein